MKFVLSKSDVWCILQSGTITENSHIFQVYLQLYLVCRHEMHIFRFLVLRGSFWYVLHAFTLDKSLTKIWYLMYIVAWQYYPKSTYFQVYFQSYLVCRHEMRIFRFLILRESFWYPLHACTLNICLIQIGYLMYITMSQYYWKSTYFQVYSQLYLVCWHEMHIFIFLVLRGIF